jgi:hypothetical protein
MLKKKITVEEFQGAKGTPKKKKKSNNTEEKNNLESRNEYNEEWFLNSEEEIQYKMHYALSNEEEEQLFKDKKYTLSNSLSKFVKYIFRFLEFIRFLNCLMSSLSMFDY